MVRQYIGARYVTKVYENSLDPSSAEWEAGVTYEPLTMVTYLNSSYLSKKEVPGATGNPASNPEYWALTGAYNGQILNLQNQIDTINNTTIPNIEYEIDELRQSTNPINKKYIVICDSYGDELNANGRNFYSEAFYRLGITNFYDFHLASSGFTQAGSLNFLAVLQNNESVITDKTEITDIIVAGGANDQTNLSDILSGISNFKTYVAANYPNAKIHIGHFTNALSVGHMENIIDSINNYRQCTEYGIDYINNSEYIMAKLSFFKNDNVHCSADGIEALTKYFIDFIISGQIDVNESITNPFIALDPDATITSQSCTFYQHNGTVTLTCSLAGELMKVSFANAKSITTGPMAINNMVSASDGFFFSTGASGANANCLSVICVCPDVINATFYANNLTGNHTSTCGLITISNGATSTSLIQIITGATTFKLFA